MERVIPLLFGKERIPPITHPDLQRAIAIVAHTQTKDDAIAAAFSCITRRYRGFRFRTYLLFWKAWQKDPNKLWNRSGFLHCTQMNYLLRVILIQSGKFTEEDMTLGYSAVWYISPHQYLIVTYNGKRIALDPWNYVYGYPMGTYATGFGYKRLSK